MDENDQKALLEALTRYPEAARVDDADKAMLAYAVKLTRAPGNVTEEDVTALRDTDFDDRAIHDICTVTAYFAFVNRIADGLGVELESGRED